MACDAARKVGLNWRPDGKGIADAISQGALSTFKRQQKAEQETQSFGAKDPRAKKRQRKNIVDSQDNEIWCNASKQESCC